MQDLLWVGYSVLIVAGALIQLWVLHRDFQQARALRCRTEAAWPLRFPVYWLDYVLGPRLALAARLGQFVFTLLLVVPLALEAARDAEALSLPYIALLTLLLVGGAGSFVPQFCTLDKRGIEFKKLYPWNCIRRWSVDGRRLLLVVERPSDRRLLEHVEIPLNGLPPALHVELERYVRQQVVAEQQMTPATIPH